MASSSNARSLIKGSLTVLAVLAAGLLVWALRHILILVFGSIVLAVILHVLAQPLKRPGRLPDRLALFLTILLVTGAIALALWLFGQEVGRQAETLQRTIPSAWQSLLERLDRLGLQGPLRQWLHPAAEGNDGVVAALRGILLSVTNAVGDTVLMVVGGIYLAAEPDLYRRGLIKLLPADARPKAQQALNDCWLSLRLWLIGRFATMVIVGSLVGLGLWMLGIPAALTLGIVAGLLEFVPFAGPVLAAVPAVLLALTVGPTTAAWVVGLYLLVQQLESNAFTPLMQRRMVSLPPALLLYALVGLGLLFGVIGVVLAEPLTVALYVLVKRLYVQGYLHTPTTIPGEPNRQENAHLRPPGVEDHPGRPR